MNTQRDDVTQFMPLEITVCQRCAYEITGTLHDGITVFHVYVGNYTLRIETSEKPPHFAYLPQASGKTSKNYI